MTKCVIATLSVSDSRPLRSSSVSLGLPHGLVTIHALVLRDLTN